MFVDVNIITTLANSCQELPESSAIAKSLVDKSVLLVYYTCRAMQSRGFPPTLFLVRTIRVWPSGKAVDFGSTIPGSNPGTRASLYYVGGVNPATCSFFILISIGPGLLSKQRTVRYCLPKLEDNKKRLKKLGYE
jgi:hypothetical protein